MAPKVVLAFSFEHIKVDGAPLQAVGADFEVRPCGFAEDDLIAAGRDAHVLILNGIQPCTRRVIQQLEECRLLAALGMGYDGLDVAAATEVGICVSNTPYYGIDAISDHAMALLLACVRKVVCLDRGVKAGKWQNLTGDFPKNVLPPMFQLRGKTLGIIGFGNSAQALVPKARGFGMRVLAHSAHLPRPLAPVLGVELVDFDYLLANSDFVSIHAGLTPQNRHLLSLAQFQLMKPTAYVINVARGPLIDQEALCVALMRGYIAGAGLDVTEQEPLPPDSPLLKLDNVVLTAHTAYYSEESTQALAQWPVEEAVRILKGQWPQALVNSEVKDNYWRRWRTGRRFDP